MMIRGEHDSPRCVRQSSSDVIRLEVRVVGQDLLVIAATCDQSDDHPDGDTEATKARLAPMTLGSNVIRSMGSTIRLQRLQAKLLMRTSWGVR